MVRNIKKNIIIKTINFSFLIKAQSGVWIIFGIILYVGELGMYMKKTAEDKSINGGIQS